MHAYATPSAPSEIHYYIQEQGLKYPLSSTTKELIRLNPRLFLGESNLFNYDPINHTIALATPFQHLLTLLVQLGELDHKALTANSLYELNAILQHSQGEGGGLLRKEKTERWELKDNSIQQKYGPAFDRLLQQLGFVFPRSIEGEVAVDHCIIFGARTEHMETRIMETLAYLKNHLQLNGHIFLLGSNRKLIPSEIEHLHSKLKTLDESQRVQWREVFSDPEHCNEANAFVFLWKCIVPHETQALFDDKVVCIHSTRIGNSYHEQFGHRVTTEITIEDWMNFYHAEQLQAIFALVEQPYIRLADQLRFTLLSKGKKASKEDLMERIEKTTFYFAYPTPSASPPISLVLDEIGRHVYRLVETLKYLESLD